ncbi:NUDIX hydrolase [Aetokthonos hydrillicola Thurmond2011]|jgi:8-oxo-dGTP pyrophosphatase MutT (NUDIX family)|uniref:NUDIX hydrolase n=1 Tax=Aetokthonos hydrillicola Thurmond2011 TaxID=2712845 RepID=A0AAP5M650_9CYAN|nr:NUDIX hydrolase [Aetokthonos hydrillicola]MBO3457487.1 NUDIX domain-containing protein [Aetokthonos hydrillicola CCALA 1050]MBW4585991.1 NUDIX hydrolase [Aetokthonos hydrillicola CCALA 1050]MDR9893780.1 NUDIX hydrolase [Aetokthonos hydrillicola Thurmond2011]
MVAQVAIAILYQENKFLMQLRDNIPTISYPGFWGLFGGHMEPGETPDVTVKREILEEIGYVLPTVSDFGCYPDEKAVRHVFHAPLVVELNQLVLSEGWDMGLVTPEDIHQGSCYSAIAGEVRPLGSIHQRILLDFMRRKNLTTNT